MAEPARKYQPQPDYRRYEAMKKRLPINLTEAEYTRAIREIARKCGV